MIAAAPNKNQLTDFNVKLAAFLPPVVGFSVLGLDAFVVYRVLWIYRPLRMPVANKGLLGFPNLKTYQWKLQMAMSPEKYWLEDYLPFEMAPFWGTFVSFRGCTFECETNQLQILETSPLYPFIPASLHNIRSHQR